MNYNRCLFEAAPMHCAYTAHLFKFRDNEATDPDLDERELQFHVPTLK